MNRLRRGLAIAYLTRRYYRSAQVPMVCTYRVCGHPCRIGGPNALSFMLEAYWNDVYGLRRFRSLGTIVDIGANIGVFSVCAARRFPESRVIAFEPYTLALDHLRRNVAGSQVQVHAAAVAGKTGKGFLKSDHDPTAATLVPEAGHDGSDYQPCPVLSFEDVVDRVSGPVSFLKLDCEGGEYPILASAGIRQVQNIAGELHTINGYVPDAAAALLRENCFTIEGWNPSASGTEVTFRARNQRRVAPSSP